MAPRAVHDQITVVAPTAAEAIREWRNAQSAADAAEMDCLRQGERSETARLLLATARELRQVAWLLMAAELQHAATLTRAPVFAVPS